MRPLNFQILPLAERRTIIEAEIKEIEGKAVNSKNNTKLQRRKKELKALDNPDVVDDTISEHDSNTSNASVSHVSASGVSASNVSASNVSANNVTTISEREFIEFLDDFEIANYNKMQYLKARYLELQSLSKF